MESQTQVLELSSMALQQEAFRAAMRRVCTPVAVVTAVDGDRAHGTTVSSFCSQSMCPPLVLVSLDAGSRLLRVVQRAGRFGINVLRAGQSDLAMRFASKGADKFAGIDWAPQSGAARLPDIAAWLGCTTVGLVPGGDHVILLGQVVAAEPGASAPLTYHSGVFGTHRSEDR